MKKFDNTPAQPSCILICGNTAFIDEEMLERITQYYKVVLVSEEPFEIRNKQNAGKIRTYNEQIIGENFSKILYSYAPDVVWYFSGYLDNGEGLSDENRKIESLMNSCSVNEISKLIVVGSVESQSFTIVKEEDKEKKEYFSPKAFSCAQLEETLRFCVLDKVVKTVLLRVPYIAGGENTHCYLGQLFTNVSGDLPVELKYKDIQSIDFLSTDDLTDLLIAVTEETMDRSGEYTVFSGYHHVYRDLGGGLKKIRPTLDVKYKEDSHYDLTYNPEECAELLRKNYGFVASDDVISLIEDEYRDYRKAMGSKGGLKEKAAALFERYSRKTVKIAEMLILFALVQILLKYTTDSVYFRYVDLRLFFVVLFGTTYGMLYGIAAGALECLSLITEYIRSGITGTMLFYNMDYWLPFAIYLMTGSITGYLMNTRERKLEFEEEEVKTLQEKYLFLNSVYQSVVDNKEEYKKQILGYQDSFGKIFEAVEKLNSSTPADIFRNGVSTLEQILENHTIAIYTLDDSQAYGRLVACSGEMSARLGKSIKIALFQEVYDTIHNSDTWKNTELMIGLPMYSYGIVDGDKVRLMICVYDAEPDQMGLYYMNLFTILCHLIRVAFLRALEYQEAIEKEKHYEGTFILLPEYFNIELMSQRKMSDAGVASYILLQIVTDDFVTDAAKLQGMIRHSDVVGDLEDGNHYLLLTQTDREIFKIIGKRLDANGIEYRIVEGI